MSATSEMYDMIEYLLDSTVERVLERVLCRHGVIGCVAEPAGDYWRCARCGRPVKSPPPLSGGSGSDPKPSARYQCSAHMVPLVRFELNGHGFWRCPVEGCEYAKPMKYGKKWGKSDRNLDAIGTYKVKNDNFR